MAARVRLMVVCAVTLMVALGGIATAQEPAFVELDDVHWDDAKQRWLDVPSQPYAAAKLPGVETAYSYGDAYVTLTYHETDTTFVGTLVAQGLKPNHAYQVKLNGKPGVDDWANQQLINLGRSWTSGDVIEGYLIFDYFVTDDAGAAIVELSLDSSYHVLWKPETQNPPGNEVFAAPTDHEVKAYAASGWYDTDYGTQTVQVQAECERTTYPQGTVQLPAGTYNVKFVITEECFHEQGLDGGGDWATVLEEYTVQFTVTSPPPRPVKYWAVVCGVADYKSINDLAYTDDDARDLEAALKRYAEWQVTDQIELLIDNAASREGVRAAIERMGQKANAATDDQDVCLFFFSGHGTQVWDSPPLDEKDQIDEVICPWDFYTADGYAYNAITDDDVAGWLAQYLPADANVVAIFDTCFSGGMADGGKGVTVKSIRNPKVPRGARAKVPFGRGLARRLAARGGRPTGGGTKDVGGPKNVVLMACQENKLSIELGPPFENGVFSYYVVEGIGDVVGGAPADDGDGLVSAEEDFAYAKPRTSNTARKYGRFRQVPQLHDGDPATEVVLVQVGEQPPPPVADLSADPTSGDAPLDVAFTDESVGDITGWSWDFGDGATSTAQNPVHTYSSGGTYTVSLTVTGPGGSDTETKVDYIIVIGEQPPDVVTITKAEYRVRTSELKVEATSSAPGGEAILTVVGYGDMTYNSKKNKYSFQAKPVGDPGGTVTVTSSLGDSATKAVKYK